ncbi:hypothetical protein CEQ90_00280 [Lewinellaceae bacterium SD302]|nr:hypothetical protein CEQ90_00280 [Lewinellaceae bacterium SD302]
MIFIIPSGTVVLVWLGALCVGLAGLVMFLRRRLHSAKPGVKDGRTKLDEANAFALSGPIHRLALCVAIGLSVLAINWTTFEDAAAFTMTIEEDIDPFDITIPPTTDFPPPPPPPPPPPVIETMEDPEFEQDTVFVDQSIDDNTAVVNDPPVVIKKNVPPPAPPPLPPPPVVEPTVLIFAERMPVFGGECKDLPNEAERKTCSDKALLGFLSRSVKYPELARTNGIAGRAVVSFTVEIDGTVTDVEILRDPGAGLGREAKRVIELINTKSDGFKAGSQQGRKVRVRFTVPINFQLD